MTRLTRKRRAVWPFLAGGAAAAACAIAGAGATIGSLFARRVLTPGQPDTGVRVWGIDPPDLVQGRPMRVWIHGPDAGLPGRYSFIFDGGAGHARLGPIVDRIFDGGVDRVAREVVAVDRGNLRVGCRGRITGWWFTDPRELAERVDRVTFPVDGGESWGWLVHPNVPVTGTWAIHVHGRGALPEETLRGIPPFARAGVTSLVIAYRNDPGAPAGLRGRYGLGLAERFDVDAAIAWALGHGADRVILTGWSMGGTTALASATRGPYRSRIAGLVLDSPGIDWHRILRRQAQLAGIPPGTGRIGIGLLQSGAVRGAVPWRTGTDLDALSAEAFAELLTMPTLIHASPGDSFVPWEGSIRLAQLRPDLVRLRAGVGEHVRLWNTDPAGWERETEAFVRSLQKPSGNAGEIRTP